MTFYRTSPRPQPSLPRKTPWWKLALWWAKGGPRRLEAARWRRNPRGQVELGLERVQRKVDDLHRLFDNDGTSALMDFRMPEFRMPELPNIGRARVARASTETDCPTCCAVAGEPCCPNEH